MTDTGDSTVSKGQLSQGSHSPDPFVNDEQDTKKGESAVQQQPPSDTAMTAGSAEAASETGKNTAASAKGTSSREGSDSQAGDSTTEAARSGTAPNDNDVDDQHPWAGTSTEGAGGMGERAGGISRRTSSATATMSERGSQTNPMQHSAFVDPSAAQDLGSGPIKIVDAQKTSDGVGQSPYIAYIIECNVSANTRSCASGSARPSEVLTLSISRTSQTLSAKRRYSEFASMRDALVTLHPTLIIPPIPSKHSLSDYAARQSKAKEDATIIARRKRMLQVFLNRIKDHEKLSRSIVFRRFLDGRWTWHEITSCPPLSTLPKSNLRAPASDPSSPHASPAYLALPVPPTSASSPLKNPNNRFLDSEAFTERFRNHMQGSLEKTNRRTVKRWTEASGDYAELGAVLNGFSLSENGALASAIERTGQAADSTFMAIGAMLQDWEIQFTEPLGEYAQFASILQKLLRWRHLKHLQYEMAQDALEAKRQQLDELERIEAEASRLNAALASGGRGLVSGPGARQGGSAGGGQGRDGVWDSVNARGNTMRKSVYGSAAEQDGPAKGAQTTSPRSQSERLADSEEWTEPSLTDSASSSRPTSPRTAANGSDGLTIEQRAAAGRLGAAGRGAVVGGMRGSHGRGAGGSSGGGGLLGALSNTLHSVMDVDPEATRRNTISRLKDSCAQLEEALELTERDLRYATNAIQTDLDRFQRQKIRDMRDMVLAFARVHRDYCRAGLEAWKGAKEEVDSITDHTPLPESSLARAQRTGSPAGGAGGGSSGSR